MGARTRQLCGAARVGALRRDVRPDGSRFDLDRPNPVLVDGTVQGLAALSDLGDAVPASLREVETLVPVRTAGTPAGFPVIDELLADGRESSADERYRSHTDP
jgi:hypothetical protein